MSDEWMVVANVMGDSTLRNGAKVVTCFFNGMPGRVLCSGLSVGGRRVKKWVRVDRLTKIRVAFKAPCKDAWGFESKVRAQAMADRLTLPGGNSC